MRRLPGRLVLVGHPVGHSLSPVLHSVALRRMGVPLMYEPLDVPPHELERVLEMLVRQRGAGNVTVPHKERAARRCARLTPVAERVGAVNTFWVDDDGALVGDNTDVAGFDALARETLGRTLTDARIALLGAGGGARAVLTAVERWRGCTVSLYNRTAPRAAALAARFPVVVDVHHETAAAVRGASLVVNATSIGMTDDRQPVPLDAVGSGAALLDLVYRSGETAWVRAARARGLRAADGLGMLIEQGALAFERWLNIPAPRDVMRQALSLRS